MNYYTFLQRPRLIILGLLGLVALLLLLRVPALNLTAPAIQGAPAANEAAVDSTTVDLAPRIHAADRKFYDNGYASGGSAPLDAYSVESVHPADRKFVYATAADKVGAGTELHPADRKFITAAYGYRDGD